MYMFQYRVFLGLSLQNPAYKVAPLRSFLTLSFLKKDIII